MGRSLAELAEAAVDAATTNRKLHLTPDEYRTLVRQVIYGLGGSTGGGTFVDIWDQEVFTVAKRRGISLPLPDVTVVVSHRVSS